MANMMTPETSERTVHVARQRMQQGPFSAQEEYLSAPVSDAVYEARYQRARKRVQDVRGFYVHVAVYLIVNLFLFALNILTTSGVLWFYWPALGWGVGLAIHFVLTFGPAPVRSEPGDAWEQRKIQEYMERDRS